MILVTFTALSGFVYAGQWDTRSSSSYYINQINQLNQMINQQNQINQNINQMNQLNQLIQLNQIERMNHNLNQKIQINQDIDQLNQMNQILNMQQKIEKQQKAVMYPSVKNKKSKKK
jgi:hypothetical protein